MNRPAIHTEHLSRSFGTFQAVDQVSLEVPEGAIFGFLGPNGAGKTTTIAMILGLLHADHGSIRIFGDEVRPGHSRALRQVGSLVGTPGMEPHLSGRANLMLLRRLHPGVDARRVDEILELVGLSAAAERRSSDYSLGMRQRLGLAAALIHQPRLLILDEPTNGLDPAGMREIRELLRRLPESGVTVFLSSHLLHEIEQICSHVAVLNQGRVVAQGQVAELLNREQIVRLRVPSADEAGAALQSLPEVKTIRGEGQELTVSGVTSEAILVHLISQGIVPSEVRNGSANLESVFFDLTGEQDKEGAEHVLERHVG
jgi:ABC-2 type transport system ATP-binding protein